MGKKKGKDKKGKGAEKTAARTDRNAEKKQKKDLQKKGEDDIEKLIAEFQEKDKKEGEVQEQKCSAPSPRCNMTFTAHPDKEELIMFGGEFFNGKQTYVYSDLFFYNIKTNEWTQTKSPHPPPPRCAHQAVALPQDGGQLWLFGGEFASPSQSQFYHYKDLWMLRLQDKRWNKINAPGGPSARSGHRMVACKKLILVFGGFHDNIRDYKYYNDLHAFNLETYTWIKLEVSGLPPAPRSGCILLTTQSQQTVLVYGGYSKERIKKDVDKGKTHTDMIKLSVDSRCKQDTVPLKWKWQPVKQSGFRPSPRCGCSAVVIPGDRAVAFGGVYDEEEDDEEVTGVFHKDMYSLEMDRAKWFQINLRGKKDAKLKKKRRKHKDNAEGDADTTMDDQNDSDTDDNDLDDEMDEELSSLNVQDPVPDGIEHMDCTTSTETEQSTAQPSSNEDNIFSVTMGPQSAATNNPTGGGSDSIADPQTVPEVFIPGPRMNTNLAVKHGLLYMYGGMYEEGDRQYTLSDMYTLDLHKLDTFNTLIECNLKLQEWQESDESDSDDEEEGDEDIDDTDDNDMEDDEADEDSDEDDEEGSDDSPAILPEETLDDYFTRNETYWVEKASVMAEKEGMKVTSKQIQKAASRMAKEVYHEHRS